VAMLLLFTLSSIPKQILHDTITGHKHDYSKSGEQTNIRAAKNNFQCNWQEQVVESPFTDQPAFHLQVPAFVFSFYNNLYTHSYYSTDISLSPLRGPPSIA
jgi:hypothetical protein